jgi:hypothetical protein
MCIHNQICYTHIIKYVAHKHTHTHRDTHTHTHSGSHRHADITEQGECATREDDKEGWGERDMIFDASTGNQDEFGSRISGLVLVFRE